MTRKRGARRQGPGKPAEPALQADIGEIVDIYCGSCRLNLDGSVSAMDPEGRVVQVTCRTCNNTQKYTSPVPDDEKRERVLRQVFAIRDRRSQQAQESQEFMRRAHSTTDVMARWRKATADADARAPLYRETDVYEAGDALIHPSHGLGVVQQILHDNAALVLFREVEVPLEMGRVDQG